MIIILILDIIFPEFSISSITSLFWTTVIIQLLNLFFQIK
jgi:hypothetical protein